ncbi:lipopolysaccharide biosynthesis protein [Algoriphagus pacificus]|uniref:Lipopolysaccharide biosynthesis protein n=1 Tax=Algoriphagus pacificus TaxID=2811234 RepID=A0ABS3CLF0_9BACT|nr:lipopolysaccharide biosynthesis protein [Algoriphagus pacificus]MBN7817590.1 lipopolysaccharide biosynthesis protein [Algoriphagus pacificus]
MTLKKKTLNGLFWSFTQQFSVQGSSILVSIILARILLPSDFGLIGMLSVFIALGNSLIDSGLTSSLIRTVDADQTDFSTVFFLNLMGSLIVYTAMFFSAPLISNFFEQPLLIDIIRVYCLSFIISAFSGVQRTRMTKQMDFKTQLKIVLPSVIISGLVGIVLAYQDFGVWALVYMTLTQHLFAAFQFWFHSNWKPSWVFSMSKLKYHFEFGYKITLSGILNSVFSNIYNVAIGKYFSVAELGYYTRADSLKQIPVQNISTSLSKVTFPMFSEIQDDNERLKNIYKRLMQQVLFWLMPVMTLASILAEPLFRFLLTEKWLPAVPFFQILCFIGIMYPIHSYNLNILKVKGRSDLYLKLEIIKKSLTTIGLFAAISFGIFGLLWVQVILNILAFLINSHYSGRLIGYATLHQIKDIIPIFIIGITMAIPVFILNEYLPSNSSFDLFRVLIGGISGMILYLLISFVFKSEPLIDFRKLVLKR